MDGDLSMQMLFITDDVISTIKATIKLMNNNGILDVECKKWVVILVCTCKVISENNSCAHGL